MPKPVVFAAHTFLLRPTTWKKSPFGDTTRGRGCRYPRLQLARSTTAGPRSLCSCCRWVLCWQPRALLAVGRARAEVVCNASGWREGWEDGGESERRGSERELAVQVPGVPSCEPRAVSRLGEGRPRGKLALIRSNDGGTPTKDAGRQACSIRSQDTSSRASSSGSSSSSHGQDAGCSQDASSSACNGRQDTGACCSSQDTSACPCASDGKGQGGGASE